MKRSTARTSLSHPMRRLAATVALTLLGAAAQGAIVEGRTSAGHRYVAGGIGTEEVDAIRQEAPAFSLQVVTAARTGAYLAGTHLRITGPGNEVILDTTLGGPWLLVDLPDGRYTVRATHAGATVERRLTIAAGKPQRIVLSFDAEAGDGEPAASDSARSRMPQ